MRSVLVIVATVLITAVATIVIRDRFFPPEPELPAGARAGALQSRILGERREYIVIGVPNVDRNRDLAPPAKWTAKSNFLSFLGKELIPHIEQQYRTTRPRMLSGWALGGLFVLYSQSAEPALFDARFAHSPAFWGDDDPNVARFQKAPKPAGGFLYISVGELEAKEAMPAALRSKFAFSPGGDHNSNPRLSSPVALWTLFTAAGK